MYNTKEVKSCVIYIRVSSERQVKGYSLDGQKHYLAECAERRGMTSFVLYIDCLLLQDQAVIDRPEYSAQIF